MKFKDLEKKKDGELQKMLAEARGTLFDLKLKSSVGQLKAHTKMKEIRKGIARILTMLNKRKQQNAETK